MKSTLITLSMLLYGVTFAQETVTPHHEIGVSFYQPFKTTQPEAAGQLPIEYVFLYDGSNVSGAQIGGGLEYKWFYNENNEFIYGRFGGAMNNRKDHIDQIVYDRYGLKERHLKFDMDLKKTQLNFAVGYGKRFQFNQVLGIEIGAALVGVADINNSIYYHIQDGRTYENGGSSERTEDEFLVDQTYAKWSHLGIAPLIRPTIQLNKHFSLAGELQMMGIMSFSSKKGHYHFKYAYRYYDQNGDLVSNYDQDDEYDTAFKGSFFSLAKMNPTISVFYKL